MIIRNTLVLVFSLFLMASYGQNVVLNGTGGAGGISNASFDQLKSNLGYKAANRAENFRVDGSPYIFENWDQAAVITTKAGKALRFKDVNIDGRRNKIVARISKDSIYTFNSLAIEKALINGKEFKNVMAPNAGPIKVYEVIAESPEFSILKDYNVEISEGSSNPMRGTVYAKYITREDYKILTEEKLDKFKPKKKKVLALLGSKKEKVEDYADENDLSFKDENDLNEIIDFYLGL